MNGLVQVGQSGSRLFVLRDAEDGSPITGASPSVTVRIGGSEAAGQGSVSELSGGSYLYTFAASEIAEAGSGYIRASATGAVTAIWPVEVVEYDPRASQQIGTPTNFTALAITPEGAVTADVEVDESSIADAVWSRSTRTLSSFGSLANDVRDAVWGATQRTLTAVSDSAGVTTLLGRLTAAWAARLDADVSSRATPDDISSAVGDLNDLSAEDVTLALTNFGAATGGDVSDAQAAIINHGDDNWIGGGGDGGDSVWTVEQRNAVLEDAAGARSAAEAVNTRLPEEPAAVSDLPDAPDNAGIAAARTAAESAANIVGGLNDLDAAAVESAAGAALTSFGPATPADISAAVAGLSTLDGAAVQAAAAAALEEYDGPNRADLTAAFEALNDLSAAEVQGVVAALLEAATVRANIASINGAEVAGTGTEADPWRSA